jgi:hypothetical protein
VECKTSGGNKKFDQVNKAGLLEIKAEKLKS